MNEVLKQVEKAIDAEINQYNALQYQKKYLKSCLNIANIKPAYGFLRERQLESLSLAKNVLKAFEKVNILPMLSGHSLLGAVRHKGFIPWESNMQFTVMAQDFWRIEEYIKNEINTENPHKFMWVTSTQTKKRIPSDPLSYEKNILEKNLIEKKLIEKKQKAYNTSSLDDELTQRINKMELEIEADALTKFQDDPFDFFTTLNEGMKKIYDSNNQKIEMTQEKLPILVIRTPFAIEFFQGTSIENAVRVEFVPYYYLATQTIEENLINTLQTQAKIIKGLIQKSITYGMVFHFYEELLKENPLYIPFSQDTNIDKTSITAHCIAAGINNYEYIRVNTNFQAFNDNTNNVDDEQKSNLSEKAHIPLFRYSDFFPLQSIEFEGYCFQTFNNTDAYLSSLFGTYQELPKYLGISPYYIALNLWLRDNHKRILPITEGTLV